MKNLVATAALALAAATSASADEDYAALHACIAETEATQEDPVFHYCTGQLVSECGAAKTAAEAVACIDDAGAALETEIQQGAAAFFAKAGANTDDAKWYLDETRANTDAACEVMAGHDKEAGLAVGQRAVNAAFCKLMASGDVYAALVRLRAAR